MGVPSEPSLVPTIATVHCCECSHDEDALLIQTELINAAAVLIADLSPGAPGLEAAVNYLERQFRDWRPRFTHAPSLPSFLESANG